MHPERVWIVGGHFDSNSDVPYSNAPGADDNGSGTAATLTIAGILQGNASPIPFGSYSSAAKNRASGAASRIARGLVSSGVQVVGFIDLDMIGWDGDKDRTVEVHSGTRTQLDCLCTALPRC